MLIALATLGVPAAALASPPACQPPPGVRADKRLESSDVVVLYRTVPATIAVGQQFAVEAVVCPAPSAGGSGLAVDAYMPEHRHGMNYRPRVSRQREGVYLEVVRHYSELDMERIHTHGEQLLRPLRLTETEMDDLVAFLETLTAPDAAAPPGPPPPVPGCP